MNKFLPKALKKEVNAKEDKNNYMVWIDLPKFEENKSWRFRNQESKKLADTHYPK